MRVRVEAAENAEVAGAVPPAPIKVEPPRVAVELNPGAGFRRGFQHFGKVHRVRFPFEEEAAGRVAQAGDVRIFHRPEEAGGVVLFVRAETGVDGSDDIIQLGQHGIREVQFSPLKNVAFRSGQKGAGRSLFVVGADGFDLGQKPFFIQPVSLKGGA